MKPRDWGELSAALGRRLSEEGMDRLDRFSSWLVEEAIPAGGMGPNEIERIGDRHIVDSLLFSRCLGDPETVWDLGSGVGLPGIPLAILMPDSSFSLIDRSRRRVDLINRASRILGLVNVTVEMGDIDSLTGRVDAIVARAVIPPQTLLPIADRHLESGGVAVVGGSWAGPPEIPGWETVEVGSVALDRPVWLLMMRHS